MPTSKKARMSQVEILLCLAFALSIAFGQVLFKIGANSINVAEGTLVARAMLNPSVWVAFAWYGLSSVLWLYILMRVPLSVAYPFALIGSALVPILSRVFFGEKITSTYVAGGLIVLLGLYVIFSQPSWWPAWTRR